MKKYKNVFLLAAMAVSAVFVACDKEPNDNEESNNASGFDGKIEAKVSVPDGIAIAEVKVTGTGDRDYAKSAKYVNGTLTVELWNPVPSEWLELTEGVKIVITRSGGFEVLDVAGNFLGTFRHRNADGKAYFFYAESDATFYGCSLKRGWNEVFVDDNTKKPSTTIPSDVKWVFE